MTMWPHARCLPKREAIRRVLYLAKVAGCRLHVCHISSPEGVEEVTRARQEGQDVTCESCPHYFVLDTDQFEEIGTGEMFSTDPRSAKSARYVGKAV